MTLKRVLAVLVVLGFAVEARAVCAPGPGPNFNTIPSTMQQLGVAVVSPPDGTNVPIPPGTQNVQANCTIDSPPGEPTNILYIVDVSGSTDLQFMINNSIPLVDANGDSIAGNAGDDFNGDGQAGETLDGEIAGVLALNNSLGSLANVRVGAVAFATSATPADVKPAAPNTYPVVLTQVFTTPPDADAGGLLGPDMNQVLASFRSEPPNGQSSIGQFAASGQTLGRNTNFVAALTAAQTALANFPPAANNIVFFLSDGASNTGGRCFQAPFPCDLPMNGLPAGTIINTVGVGLAADPVDLQYMATYTGGVYTQVNDPSNLSVVLPGITPEGIGQVLINGVPQTLLVGGNFTTDVTCPGPGPFNVTATCVADDPAMTTVSACITLNCFNLCGNTVLDPGEECDPPNGTTCDPNCQRVPSCGDTFIDAPEECEPPNTLTCNALCQNISCGDSVTEGSEECDPPNGTTCDEDCQRVPMCGDTFIDFPPEQCEPPGVGNCDLDCTFIVCGNGDVEAGEECELPNTPTCDAFCQRIPICNDGNIDFPPEQCEPPNVGNCDEDCTFIVCGNGDVEAGEECELPNTPTCDAFCQRIPICNDGNIDAPEQCEPPNTPNCDANCLLIQCGNMVIQPGEECDPPNGVLCDEDCQRIPFCNDGNVDFPEDCDPPNGTTCDFDCTFIQCGNGETETQVGEECDPPNGSTCDEDCHRIPVCGDGYTDAPENCEPPNTLNCDANCRLIQCGNGIQQPGEECDPPNGTTCDEDCQNIPICGDGTVEVPQEECEPPNTPTCDALCQYKEVCTGNIDEDGDGLIDCLDPDCPPCPPIQKDPAKIKLDRTGLKPDSLKAHGSFGDADVPLNFDPATDPVTVTLSNLDGLIYRGVIPGGLMVVDGVRMSFKDKKYGTGDGLTKVKIVKRGGMWVFSVLAKGNLKAATSPQMRFQLELGADSFSITRNWQQTSWGWYLPFDNF